MDNRTVVYGEYADYTSYKDTYDELQRRLIEQEPIEISAELRANWAKVA